MTFDSDRVFYHDLLSLTKQESLYKLEISISTFGCQEAYVIQTGIFYNHYLEGSWPRAIREIHLTKICPPLIRALSYLCLDE